MTYPSFALSLITAVTAFPTTAPAPSSVVEPLAVTPPCDGQTGGVSYRIQSLEYVVPGDPDVDFWSDREIAAARRELRSGETFAYDELVSHLTIRYPQFCGSTPEARWLNGIATEQVADLSEPERSGEGAHDFEIDIAVIGDGMARTKIYREHTYRGTLAAYVTYDNVYLNPATATLHESYLRALTNRQIVETAIAREMTVHNSFHQLDRLVLHVKQHGVGFGTVEHLLLEPSDADWGEPATVESALEHTIHSRYVDFAPGKRDGPLGVVFMIEQGHSPRLMYAEPLWVSFEEIDRLGGFGR